MCACPVQGWLHEYVYLLIYKLIPEILLVFFMAKISMFTMKIIYLSLISFYRIGNFRS